jgi:uncharacterized protein
MSVPRQRERRDTPSPCPNEQFKIGRAQIYPLEYRFARAILAKVEHTKSREVHTMSADRPSRAGIGHRPVPPSAGVGLHGEHCDRILEQRPSIAWFGIHAGRRLGSGLSAGDLIAIAAQYPISLHALGLALTSASPAAELERLRELVLVLQPALISDDLTWDGDGAHPHEALPYTNRALGIVVRNIHRVQEALRRRLLIRSPLRTSAVRESTLSESEFLSEVMLRTGCGVLLDLDSLHRGGGPEPCIALRDFLGRIDADDIAELHLPAHAVPVGSMAAAGPREERAHRRASMPQLWELFEAAVAEVGPVPTLVTSDDPPCLEDLLARTAAVQAVLAQHDPARHRARAD